jgi:hypothetical protein
VFGRSAGRDIEALDAVEHPERQVVRGALVERVAEQHSGVPDITAIERIEALVHQGLRFALPLGLGASRALDVGPSTIVMPVKKEDPRPEVDGGFEVAREIVVEAADEQLLDARILSRRAGRVGWKGRGRLRISHG